MKLTLVKKEKIAPNIISFYFQPETPVRYIAGQYIELHLPHDNPDDRRTNRWFTLSSSPTEELLAITTRLHERSSSFKNSLNNLEIGSVIRQAQLPMGDFVLPKDSGLPLIFVAGGIGITPYRSICKYLFDTGQQRDITLVYAAKPDELIFSELIKKAGVKLIVSKSRLNSVLLLDYTGPISNQQIYISGPEKMVENLQHQLIEHKISASQLRTDFFHNYD